MKKERSTKRALLLSVLAMVLCVSMLIGTTFAWFTDSVTSSNNRIAAGNLDIELYYQDADMTEWAEVDEDTNIFKEDALWEPGHTEVIKLKIANAGSLALKYQLGVNIVNETGSVNVYGDPFSLSDYIYFGIVEGEAEYATRDAAVQAVDVNASLIREGYSKASSLEAKDESVITMVVYMPTDIGNEANYAKDAAIPEINLGLNLYATQFTSEADSFGNQYDDVSIVSDADALKVAIAEGKDIVLMADVALNGDETLTVADSDSILLDLNGHTISAVSTATGKNLKIFTVKGEMSVIGNGTVSFVHKGDNMGWNNLTAAFSVEGGELTLGKGVIVENGGGSDMAYGVDVNTTLGKTVLNVDGVTILSTYTGVRIFNNHKTAKGIVNYNSGLIVGENRDIWNQSTSASAVVENAIVNIADGYAYTTEATSNGGCKYFFEDDMTLVGNIDTLKTAIDEGGKIVLLADIADVDANTAITVASGKEVILDLNGHKLSSTANKSGNQELFLVKGTMTVTNGSLELVAANNQGWNAMATLFDVTAGGVLNMTGVAAKVSGTDMNFIVHLNNWGSATLNVDNCDFTASYVAVRAFNSGYDMNTVTIENTNVSGGARLFWVHNYTSEGKDDSTLTLDIYSNNNTCENEKPVRFGFDVSEYYDLDGVEIN